MKTKSTVAPFLPALILTVIISATSPFMAVLRDSIFDHLPHRATAVLSGGSVLIAFGFSIWAWRRARSHLVWSGVVFALLVGLVSLQTITLRTGSASVDVVERIHIIEYGAVAFLLCRAFSTAYRTTTPSELGTVLLLVAIAGTAEESVQFMVETRIGEIRDVLLDCLGGVCGALFWMGISSPTRFRWRPARARLLARTGALALVVIGWFFSAAHIGHEISDPELGRFVSWHSLEDLEAARDDRARRWAANPPVGLSPWRLEDRYLTEAGSHAGHRNASYEEGHLGLALGANEILEKYFGPYLALDGFLGEGPRHYPDWITAELDRERERMNPSTYQSPVLRSRIFTRVSSTSFMTAVIVVAGLVLTATFLTTPDRSRAMLRRKRADTSTNAGPRHEAEPGDR